MMKLEMKFRSDYLQKAAEFFYKELLPRSNLSVKIYRDPREPISDTFMYTWGIYDVCLATGMDRKNALLTLAHEFVHIKQFHKKELVPIHMATKWKGQVYNGSFIDAPWEKEADILEQELVSKFADHKYKYKLRSIAQGKPASEKIYGRRKTYTRSDFACQEAQISS